MTDEELLLDACYAYEDLAGLGGMTDKHREAYKKIRARLEKPWVKTYSGNKPNYTEPPCKTGSSCTNKCERCGEVNPADIHTCTPKQRELVGLTNEEIEEIYTNAMSDFDFIFDTQAKLKEKNSTTEKNIQTSDKND